MFAPGGIPKPAMKDRPKPGIDFWILLLLLFVSSCCGYAVGFDDATLPIGGPYKPWSRHGAAIMHRIEGH